MPIEMYQFVGNLNDQRPGYRVAKELAKQTAAQFGAVRGVKIGISLASCCAAVAIKEKLIYKANELNGYIDPPVVQNPQNAGRFQIATFGAPLNYGIVFGNSRIAAGGMDRGDLAGHAERCALTAANGKELFDFDENGKKRKRSQNAILFVELHPCGDDENSGCQGWLNGIIGSGISNPYNGIINGDGNTTLHVWWRWTYPEGDGFAQMVDFHRQNLQIQLAQINNNW